MSLQGPAMSLNFERLRSLVTILKVAVSAGEHFSSNHTREAYASMHFLIQEVEAELDRLEPALRHAQTPPPTNDN